jgi:hypothetical protein
MLDGDGRDRRRRVQERLERLERTKRVLIHDSMGRVYLSKLRQ